MGVLGQILFLQDKTCFPSPVNLSSYKENCKDIPKQECHTTYDKKCKDIPHEVKIFFIDSTIIIIIFVSSNKHFLAEMPHNLY